MRFSVTDSHLRLPELSILVPGHLVIFETSRRSVSFISSILPYFSRLNTHRCPLARGFLHLFSSPIQLDFSCVRLKYRFKCHGSLRMKPNVFILFSSCHRTSLCCYLDAHQSISSRASIWFGSGLPLSVESLVRQRHTVRLFLDST